jgi:hypothetical protein
VHWQTVGRPGHSGKERDERQRGYDVRHGTGRWRIAWQLGERIGELVEAVMLYEDAYLAYLTRRADLLEPLLATAADVYDDAESNVDSGLDYTRQETDQTHLQDVAIRRCVVRLGRVFRGAALLQVRTTAEHPLGAALSPTMVPFHRPELIVQPYLEGWWTQKGGPASVESFYQSNKLLQVQAGP